jgi:hypothetical protein
MMKIELQAQESNANMQLQIGKEQMTHMRELLKIEKKDEADQAKLDLDAALGAAKIQFDYDKMRTDSRTKIIAAASKPKPTASAKR